MTIHWTERSTKDYHFRIAADFIAQLEEKMESESITQDKLAELIGVTKGRVSQVLNNPGNLTIGLIVKFARALGMKVSLVAYDDDDPGNTRGPINSEIFKICWEDLGKPHDMWAFESKNQTPWTDISQPMVYDPESFVYDLDQFTLNAPCSASTESGEITTKQQLHAQYLESINVRSENNYDNPQRTCRSPN